MNEMLLERTKIKGTYKGYTTHNTNYTHIETSNIKAVSVSRLYKEKFWSYQNKYENLWENVEIF